MLPRTPHPSLQLLKMLRMPVTFFKKEENQNQQCAVITILCHLPLSTKVLKRNWKGKEICRSINSTFTKGAAASRCEGPSQWDGASQQVEVLVALGSCFRWHTMYQWSCWHCPRPAFLERFPTWEWNRLPALVCETLLLWVLHLAQCASKAWGETCRADWAQPALAFQNWN